MMQQVFSDRPLRTAAVVTLLIAVPVMLVLGPDSFLLMLGRSFLRQWVLLYVLGAIGFCLIRRFRIALTVLCSALVMAGQIPWCRSHHAVAREVDGGLRVGQFNVLQPNGRKEAVLRTVRESEAEVLSFQEVDEAWAVVLDSALTGQFPYRVIVPRSDCYGIALFSKHPLEGLRVIDLHGAPVAHAVVRKHGLAIAVTAVHARSPLPYAAFQKRNRQLRTLAALLSQVRLPQIVIGDLNAVPWDAALVRFAEDAGGLRIPGHEPATFPSTFGVPLMAIDHVLASAELAVIGQRAVPLSGSDHRALIADIVPSVP